MATSKAGGKNTDAVSEKLSKAVADTYALLAKTHYYHWNVEGPRFLTLHQLFEEQYNELFAAADELAERLRALKVYAPGGLGQFKALTSIAEPGPMPIKAEQMIADLQHDNELMSKLCQELIEATDEAGDDVTNDIMIGRKTAHDKAAWMLRANLAA